MDVKEYMERDFELLEKRVSDVSKAYQNQDPGLTMSKSSAMFESFSRRFQLEDFLLSKISAEQKNREALRSFLSRRKKVRDQLEDMLMLHVSEPDFIEEIARVLNECKMHLQFLRDDFYPNFLDKLSDDDWQYIGNALEDRLHQTAFD